MIVDVVLLPPKAVSEKIGKFVREFHKTYKLKMLVDNRKLLPHISLLHIYTSAKNIPAIISRVEIIAAGFSKQILRFTAPRTGRDYFVYDVHKSSALQKLHQQIVKNIGQFKTGFSGIGNPKGERLERQYIKKYGAGNILKNFQPHVTLGLARRRQDLAKIKSELSKERWGEFGTNRLAVTQVNSHHQVFKVIKEFKLK